jgi:hypothetical protein
VKRRFSWRQAKAQIGAVAPMKKKLEKNFKKCGISNSLDGSEDDFIRYSDDNHVSSADDVSNEE